ncbi:MAG: YebC/PmpR family DNA-binding transcriptional regulator [Gammaproteobacteria bacterium]
MAGHSKWANIQHRKNAQDKKRGKLFTKLIREITVAARMGGADPDANPRLRDAVRKALGSNMTRDTVDRAIKRGAGGADGEDIMEVRYEGYGPSGVAVMVDCMTDNRNRTVAEVRHVFSKCGGNLGTDGSVAYLFTKQGQISIASGANEDEVMEIALEAGAEDIVVNEDNSIDVITAPDNFEAVHNALSTHSLSIERAEITMAASTHVDINELELAEKMVKLLDMLEDLDDVQAVYSNADMTDDVIKQLQ